MTGYITFYSSAEINELELSQIATDFLKQGGIVRQGGDLGFAAAQLSPLDGLKYNITSGGSFYILNSSYAANGSNPRFWLGRVSGATETLTFAANSSGSTRVDLIAIKVDTTVTDANADNTGVVSLVVVQGTPGAGVPATPANHVALYQVTIVNGETEITDAEVTDVRTENKLINTLYDEIELDNNKAIKEKDSTGTLRELLKLDSSNKLVLGSSGISLINLMKVMTNSFQHKCVAYLNTNASMAGSSTTTFSLGAEVVDTGDMHSNSVNPTRITVQEAGVYLVVGQLRLNTVPANDRIAVMATKNGTAFANNYEHTGTSTGVLVLQSVGIDVASAGDYYELQGFNGNASAQTAIAGSDATKLSVVKLA